MIRNGIYCSVDIMIDTRY